MDQTTAEQFARNWYAAWNRHDLDEILSHYADDVEMTSPLVVGPTGASSNRIVGKEALRDYFAAGLERYPTLSFEPLELYVGVDSLVLRYRWMDGRLSAEVMFLDDAAKVRRYFAHYGS